MKDFPIFVTFAERWGIQTNIARFCFEYRKTRLCVCGIKSSELHRGRRRVGKGRGCYQAGIARIQREEVV
ncbi:hypothetical protein LINPERHAP1_LOCUS15167 [Linum perenne]